MTTQRQDQQLLARVLAAFKECGIDRAPTSDPGKFILAATDLQLVALAHLLQDPLVQAMKRAGWRETAEGVEHEDGDIHGIVHKAGMGPFPDWESAIEACIEVASGV